MVGSGRHGYWVILLTFLVAYVLAVVPLPAWLLWGRPEWLALVLLYWTIALPHRVGIFTGFTVGIVLDVLEGAVLGQNALSLAILTFLAMVLYQRMRVTNLWQQAAMVFLLIGINQLICQWVQNLQGIASQSPLFLLSAVSSAMLWPAIFQVLRSLRRYYRVS